jgi:uncharacterized protein involved in exopolysaccharide biosynthesis
MDRDRDRHLLIERQLADLEQQPDDVPAAPAGGVPTPEQQLTKLKDTLATMQLRLKADHPDIQRLLRAIRDLEQKIVADGGTAEGGLSTRDLSRRRRIDDLHAELDVLDRQIAKKQADEQRLREEMTIYRGRLEAVPTRESEMTEMNRDYETLQEMYRSLLSKKEESRIAASSSSFSIRRELLKSHSARIACG